jgi:hypothetical protein
MLSVIQGTTNNDTQGALAILQTLSVDSKYKARLEELQAAAKKASESIEALRQAEQVAERKLAATEAMQNSMIAEADKVAAEAATLKQEAASLHAGVAVREANLTKAMADHEVAKKAWAEQLKAECAIRDADLVTKRDAITADDKKVKARGVELATVAAQLETRKGYLDKAAAEVQAKDDELNKYEAALMDIVNNAHAMFGTLHAKTTELVK